MPDIDLDIPDIQRNTVIKYMYQKYGMDHAAQILTFGTIAAKQVLRDVGRFMLTPWKRRARHRPCGPSGRKSGASAMDFATRARRAGERHRREPPVLLAPTTSPCT